MLAALTESVQAFSDLSAVGKQNVHDLVTSAGVCMNLGDKADRITRAPRERYRALEAPAQGYSQCHGRS